MITKMLGTAIVLGSLALGAGPAGAEPSPSGTDPNPFGGLTCNCRETAPAGDPVRMGELGRGLRGGLAG
jgi:hypothetical protein